MFRYSRIITYLAFLKKKAANWRLAYLPESKIKIKLHYNIITTITGRDLQLTWAWGPSDKLLNILVYRDENWNKNM